LAVVAALLLSLLGLAALWGLLRAGLALNLWLMERWSQACRDAITIERLQWEGQRQQQALNRQRRSRRGWSLVDLDGRTLALEASQLEPFARRCRAELGLSGPCSVSELRHHWRRSSLRWHPDQGGDNEAWLRRLRAYEALRQLGHDATARQLVKAMPPPLPAVSRRRRHWLLF
jgi:hypothetical protein